MPSKFVVVMLIVAMGVGTLNVSITTAYFNDQEKSTGNTFSAGTLDIVLDSMSSFNSSLLYPTDSALTTISLINIGSLGAQYIAQTELSGSDTSACDYITMTATSSTSSFTGLIKDFISSATTTTDAIWNFNFTINAGAPPSVWGKTCFFKWKYTSWQDNLPDSSSGFSSVKEKLGSVRIGKAVVLNEFIPNPSGIDTALMPGGEWVELYNNSNLDLDLSGWVIYDNDDSHELYITNSNTDTGGTIIKSHRFLVVYKNGDSDFNLNNAGDSVRLATGYPIASSVIVDSYIYTEEKPEGYSYARIPDGIGAWVDPIPTPGGTNNFSEILETTEELIATSTASTTLMGSVGSANIPENIATTTELTESVATTTATTTENTIEDVSATTTLDILPIATSTDSNITASTTENIIEDLLATTTPDILLIATSTESISSTTENIIENLTTGTTTEIVADSSSTTVTEIENPEVVEISEPVSEPVVEPEVVTEPVIESVPEPQPEVSQPSTETPAPDPIPAPESEPITP